MEHLMSSLERLQVPPEHRQQAALFVVALGASLTLLLFARVVASFLRGASRWLRVAVGTSTVPRAPGGGLFLGHALQLATAPCPWERMLEWARASGPIVRFNILQRTGLVVNDPQGAKRIFQVGWGGVGTLNRQQPTCCAGAAAVGRGPSLWCFCIPWVHCCMAFQAP